MTAVRLRAHAAALRAMALSLEADADDIERGDDTWLTVEEAAAIARKNVRVLRDAARANELAVGNEDRLQRRELDRWLSVKPTRRKSREAGAANDDGAPTGREAARQAVMEAAARVRGSR
jgi:hypothetical protein